MNELINLILLTHANGIESLMLAIESDDNPEYEESALLTALQTDDTFNAYDESTLSAAVGMALARYAFTQ